MSQIDWPGYTMRSFSCLVNDLFHWWDGSASAADLHLSDGAILRPGVAPRFHPRLLLMLFSRAGNSRRFPGR